MAFTRMDQGLEQEWLAVQKAVHKWQSRMPERIKALLRQLEAQTHGHGVNQLQHALQTATRALRHGAREELVIGALCHDIGNVISVENHPAIAAEILKPYVSFDLYQIIRTHQDFQGRYYFPLGGKDPDARGRYKNEAWYETACRFSDEWDQASFDPDYDTLPLDHFEPMIDRVFGEAKRNRSVLNQLLRPAVKRIWFVRKIGELRRWARIRAWSKQRAH